MREYSFDTAEAMRLWEQGLTDPEIGELVDADASYIRQWRLRNGLLLRNKAVCFDEELAREMWRKGACDPEIAAAMYVERETISYWRRRNGLKGNRPKRDVGQAEGYHQGVEKYKRERRREPEHLCDKTCADCKYFCLQVPCCDYIGQAKRRRPCPAGKGCTVKERFPVQNRNRYRFDHDEALKLYNEGRNDVDIAQQLKISPAAVRWWRKQNNLPSHITYKKDWDRKKARELYSQGWTDRQIAEALDIAPSVVWNWRAREGLPRHGK